MITVCGGGLSLQDLEPVEVERPENAGNRWRGVKHYDFAKAVDDQLQEAGVRIVDRVFALDNSNANMVGGFSLVPPDNWGVPAIQGFTYALGMRNSNDQKWACRMSVGGQVMVCHNGVITGEFILTRKHTSNINIQEEVRGGLETFKRSILNVNGEIVRMQEMGLATHQKDHILMEAARRDLLAWGHIGLVDKEYENPKHDEFRNQTAWSLYNAYTATAQAPVGEGERIRPRFNPQRQMDGLNGMRNLICRLAA